MQERRTSDNHDLSFNPVWMRKEFVVRNRAHDSCGITNEKRVVVDVIGVPQW